MNGCKQSAISSAYSALIGGKRKKLYIVDSFVRRQRVCSQERARCFEQTSINYNSSSYALSAYQYILQISNPSYKVRHFSVDG